jgi:hypothetical protein
MRRLLAALVAISFSLALSLAPSSGRGDEVPISEVAKRRFRAGVALLDDPDGPRYEDAYREFLAAYEASPSPKILGNLGICAMKLERDGEAIEAFEGYLKGAGDIGAAERKQMERDLQTLRTTVVSLELEVSPDGVSLLDERVPLHGDPIVNRYGPLAVQQEIGIRRGKHRLTFDKPGFEKRVIEIDATGERLPLSVELLRAGTEETPGGAPSDLPVGGIVMASLSGAFAIASAVTGGLALERQAAFEAANNGASPPVAEQIRDQGMGLNIATDVLIGLAAASAIASIVLFVVEADEADSGEPATGARAPCCVLRW